MLLRIVGILSGLLILLSCVVAGWFFFYSADLPIAYLRQYAPQQTTRVSDRCTQSESIAIPYDAIGPNLRAALNSAEAYTRSGQAGLATQLSRMTFCEPSRMLERHIQEARVAAQLGLHFSRDELLTIYANRVWLGEGQFGVENASQHYFGKDPNQLNIAESALLAGLIRGPFIYSPYKHPDRALRRRNQVIDLMVEDHSITVAQAEAAKTLNLAVVRK